MCFKLPYDDARYCKWVIVWYKEQRWFGLALCKTTRDVGVRCLWKPFGVYNETLGALLFLSKSVLYFGSSQIYIAQTMVQMTHFYCWFGYFLFPLGNDEIYFMFSMLQCPLFSVETDVWTWEKTGCNLVNMLLRCLYTIGSF